MKIPPFVREVVWSFYPPRYKELSEKRFRESLKYLSKVLLVAFLIAGVFLLPSVATLKGTIEDEFSKFSGFTIESNITQSAPIAVPPGKPLVTVDLNAERVLAEELFVIDNSTVQYRLLKIGSIPQELLKQPSQSVPRVSGFFTVLLIMLLPGIALFLYVRMWLKYLLMILVLGTFVFLIMELTKFRVKYRQALNIATHALTPVVFLEVIAGVFSASFLIPVVPFLGVKLYAISAGIMLVLMLMGVTGVRLGKGKK